MHGRAAATQEVGRATGGKARATVATAALFVSCPAVGGIQPCPAPAACPDAEGSMTSASDAADQTHDILPDGETLAIRILTFCVIGASAAHFFGHAGPAGWRPYRPVPARRHLLHTCCHLFTTRSSAPGGAIPFVATKGSRLRARLYIRHTSESAPPSRGIELPIRLA